MLSVRPGKIEKFVKAKYAFAFKALLAIHLIYLRRKEGVGGKAGPSHLIYLDKN